MPPTLLTALVTVGLMHALPSRSAAFFSHDDRVLATVNGQPIRAGDVRHAGWSEWVRLHALLVPDEIAQARLTLLETEVDSAIDAELLCREVMATSNPNVVAKVRTMAGRDFDTR